MVAACFISVVVTSIAFNVLDAVDFYSTGEDCRTLFCDMRWGRVLVTLMAGVAIVPVLAVRLERVIRRRVERTR